MARLAGGGSRGLPASSPSGVVVRQPAAWLPRRQVNSYTEFKEEMLPRIRKLGYNAIQIMAIQVCRPVPLAPTIAAWAPVMATCTQTVA